MSEMTTGERDLAALIAVALPNDLQPVGVGFKIPAETMPGYSDEHRLTEYGRVLVEALASAFEGWVSPEEAKTREAAARREALLEAAESLPSMTEGDRREGTRRWPLPQRNAYSLAIEEAQGALRALAEPERDEEPEEIHHCDGCGEDYNILAESHIGHQPERDEEGR